MAKAKKEMADKLRGTTDHDLRELVGKKIKSPESERVLRLRASGLGSSLVREASARPA